MIPGIINLLDVWFEGQVFKGSDLPVNCEQRARMTTEQISRPP